MIEFDCCIQNIETFPPLLIRSPNDEIVKTEIRETRCFCLAEMRYCYPTRKNGNCSCGYQVLLDFCSYSYSKLLVHVLRFSDVFRHTTLQFLAFFKYPFRRAFCEYSGIVSKTRLRFYFQFFFHVQCSNVFGLPPSTV